MSKYISVKKRPRLKEPVLVAAWPGMGDVAFKAALYLRDKLKAKEFADLSVADYVFPSSVWIENSIISLPQKPVGRFYHYKSPGGDADIVIFISDTQPFIEKGYSYAREIIDFAKSLNVKEVYTFAAMPLPIEHTQIPQVHVAATKKEMLDCFIKMKLQVIPMGQISGLNGLILGVAKEQGLDGACLLGEIPLYTIQIENPMASMAILSVLTRLLRVTIDLSPLRKHADQIHREIEHLIHYLKNPALEAEPIDQKEIDIIKKGLADSTTLPESASRRINELFKLAKRDLGRALELKLELDKWNVYEQFEDSFLDLFKKPPKKDN